MYVHRGLHTSQPHTPRAEHVCTTRLWCLSTNIARPPLYVPCTCPTAARLLIIAAPLPHHHNNSRGAPAIVATMLSATAAFNSATLPPSLEADAARQHFVGREMQVYNTAPAFDGRTVYGGDFVTHPMERRAPISPTGQFQGE